MALISQQLKRTPTRTTLEEIRSVEAGLDPGELQSAIEAGAYKKAVDDAVAEAREMGVRAVPLFVLREELAIEGAQTLDVFREAMQQVPDGLCLIHIQFQRPCLPWCSDARQGAWPTVRDHSQHIHLHDRDVVPLLR